MKSRAEGARRVLKVQRYLYEMAETRYLKKKAKVDACDANSRELVEALGGEGGLHGLFTDVTVKRIEALKQKAGQLRPEVEELRRVFMAQTGKYKTAQRVSEDLDADEQRLRERQELDELIEATLSARTASLKQDQ